MERHPYFDLWLHSSHEISEMLSVEIAERITLHEWPLSCVQLLRLANGSQLIYKSQLRATTVEPEFYDTAQRDQTVNASHCLSRLPRANLLGTLHNSVGMTFEYIDAPRFEDFQLNEAEIVDHGNRLLSDIRQFPSDLPVYIDISSLGKWSTLVQETIILLDSLITSGQFQLTTSAAVQLLAEWSRSNSVRTALQSPSCLNHGDLGGDNVFVIPGGYKIIDWQRPVRGPAELDRTTYLAAMGVDPSKYISREILGLFWFLRLRWLVECKVRWFPQGDSYDSQVAEFADHIFNS
jgi:hypothetical protein